MKFIYRKSTYRQETEYTILLINDNKRLIHLWQIYEMLNIQPDDFKQILIDHGAKVSYEEDIDGLVYKRTYFNSLETVIQTLEYLNLVYAPILAILYNDTPP